MGPSLLIYDAVTGCYVLPEIVRMKLMLHEVEVQWNRRVAAFDLWFPPELHVWHHAGARLDQWHRTCLLQIKQRTLCQYKLLNQLWVHLLIICFLFVASVCSESSTIWSFRVQLKKSRSP